VNFWAYSLNRFGVWDEDGLGGDGLGGNGFFILTDLISFELNGCEASQFAVAATNENRPIE